MNHTHNPASPSRSRLRLAGAWATTLLHLATLTLAVASLATPATAKAAVALDEEPIPAALVLPLDPTGRPSPVCSQCQIVAKTKPSAGSDAAQVSFTFAGENSEGFDGSVRIRVKLYDGSVRWPYGGSLSLADEETRTFELHSAPYGFEWEDVDTLYFELVDPS